MASTKSTLKASKVALDAKDFVKAAEEASKTIDSDPNNYHAHVFLGLALEKQNQYDASEAAYRGAIQIKHEDVLAWQGLATLYGLQPGKKLDEYHGVASRLADIYIAEDDKFKCQTVIDKYTDDARKFGSRSQYRHSLEILVPPSPIAEFLEGRILRPDVAYIKIADIVEAEEKEQINFEIGQRRTRLGAKIDQVTVDVKREILGKSPLEGLYASIIDWTHDDELRRDYEERILRRANETLTVLPMLQKQAKREQVQRLANGLVILKHAFLLAWEIGLEWQDVDDLEALDIGMLKDFIRLFPKEGLSKVTKGYLESDASAFPKVSDNSDGEDDAGDGLLSIEDRLIMMTEGMDDASSSILAHRFMCLYYLHLEEWESTVKLAREGLKLVTKESNIFGLTFANSKDALDTTLATALVQYQAPRHHAEARLLFENVLSRNNTDTSALIGIGLIYEEQEDFAEASKFLDQALGKKPDPKIRAEAAWCKYLDGDRESGLAALEACLPDLEDPDVRTKAVRSQTLHRIGTCIWDRDSNRQARKDRKGAYAYFLSSLQADMNYAPAYTSLGIYYEDYAKDRKRARKCFQKAFELSASEVTAAERLATSFANSNEWDLVEVVAQRVVDSGKTRPPPGSKKKPISWPLVALGVVQLNNQDYAKSIISFQSSLRLSPENYRSWVGLGEAYHNSGRYIAATKAFEHAQQLDDTVQSSADEQWFASYMLANVKRELGEFDDAIARYRETLSSRPSEYGVAMALLQCLVEASWHDIERGLFGSAAELGANAIRAALEMSKAHREVFNLWKTVGDACSVFTYTQSHAAKVPHKELYALLGANVEQATYDFLAHIDGVDQRTLTCLSSNVESHSSSLVDTLQSAILAHKRAIHACANNAHAKAVAWYNLGWTEYRVHVCGLSELQHQSKRPLRHLKAAVQCFKKAIELEAGNAEFWNALGVVTAELNPRVSQHSLIRSLYLNDKNARVWTNLGTLYLLQGDTQLANEAFTRAQSTDPDYANAWAGQGMLAAQVKDINEARHLFTHAFEIADSSSVVIKQNFAKLTFDYLCSATKATSVVDTLQPLLALHQLQSEMSTSNQLAFDRLLSLFAERAGDYESARCSLEAVCAKLEAEYEGTESPDTLLRFAQSKADLARVQLAGRAFSDSAENAITALDLSADEDTIRSTAYQRLRLSAHVTAGLAYYYQSSMDQSIDMFKTALHETDGNPEIVCLVSQTLWAKGGDEERDAVREQLLDCVERVPEHVDAIMLLAAIALLDGEVETLEAVTTDLEAILRKSSLSSQEQAKITRLLVNMTTLGANGEKKQAAEISQATSAIMLAPSQPYGWGHLAVLSGDPYTAEMRIKAAVNAVPPDGALEATDLCQAYSGSPRPSDAQKAIMIAPWQAEGWEALS